MALDITPVNRNLHTRATFLALEFEDLFVVLILAAVMNVVSHFVSGSLSPALQYGVPLEWFHSSWSLIQGEWPLPPSQRQRNPPTKKS